jgi:hypothetical protein
VPLVDDLLVLQNSDDDVFMHISSQKFYIVLAGRWYQADSLTGPWAFQAADDLPNAFADIPRDSDQADSRVYVAGTQEAKDAVLDAQIPQTAAVQRGEVDIEVTYDGEPVYQPVDGTDLVYIRNTGSTVLRSGGLYYLVEEGVWYVSSSPNGPWQVSDHRPEEVDTILPTSPVYNTKYVHVYESTPSVVYVGYTPGYTGSYVYHNTLFYGTGWYYRPWVSPYYYYPRFSTWGFNVSYNPWYGWNFGLSWGWGPFSVNYYSGGYWHRNHHWYHRHHGRWGPGRYRHRPAHYGRGHDRYAHNGYRRGGRDRYNDRGGYDNGRDHGGYSRPRGDRQNNNLYRDESQRASVARTRDRQTRSSDRYAGENRQIYNSTANGMRVRSNAGKSKTERNRLGPVSPSEIRTKANMRDINREANHSNLLADNSGRVYSKAERKSNRKSQLGGVGSKERSTSLASVQPAKTRTTGNRNTRQPSRGDGALTRQSQSNPSGYSARQRSASQAKTPKQQSRPGIPGNSTRQQQRVAVAPVRQTRQGAARKHTTQKPARRVSAPVQRQSRQAKASPPNNSRSGGPGNKAPAQKAPRSNTSKSNQKRSGAKSNKGISRGRSRNG